MYIHRSVYPENKKPKKLFYWTNSMENQTCKPPELEQLFLDRHLKTVVQSILLRVLKKKHA